jgi:diguanylate cyclase (GGDEF)-like protein
MSSAAIRLEARLRRLPDAVAFAIGAAALLALIVFKLTAGRSVLIIDFFLVPVAGVAWLTDRRASAHCLAVMTAAATVPLAIDIQGSELGAAIAAAAARYALYALVITAIGVMRSMQLKNEREARTDAHTGTVNSRGFRETAGAEIVRSQRSGEPMSLLYLDIDAFKGINDRLGHAAGDRVLSDVGTALRGTVRLVDTVARLGGDEFAVLAPGTDMAAARALADRVQASMGGVRAADGVAITCSIGLATFAAPPATVDELLAAADRLMYRAKSSGKGRMHRERLHGPAHAQA